jgi:hypothetical protein
VTKQALFIHAIFFAAVFFLLAALTMIPGVAYAALPIYEPFADANANSGTSYTVGAAVPGQSNAATGSGAHWFAAGTTVGAPTPANNTIATGNLSISGLAASSGSMMEYGVSAGPSATKFGHYLQQRYLVLLVCPEGHGFRFVGNVGWLFGRFQQCARRSNCHPERRLYGHDVALCCFCILGKFQHWREERNWHS